MLKYIKKMAAYLVIAVFFVAVDRFFKILALNYFENYKLDLISDYFGLTFAKNYYIAFSLPVSGIILIFFICVLIIVLLAYWLVLIKKEEYLSASCLTFIIFGAISNIVDRLEYGYVIDYLDLKYFTVFNVADAMIVAGTLLLLFFQIKKDKNKS